MKDIYEIDYIYEKLSKLYPRYTNRKPKVYAHAYTILIGVMLSAQSQDKRTAVACKQLFDLAETPQDMIRLTQEQIIEAIKPAGLYNAKSKNILATSKKLLEEYNGRVPQTQEELMKLPGVGRKSSDIVMRFVWGEPHIITHAKKVCKSRSPGCNTCVIDKVCDKRMIDVPKSKLRDAIKIAN